MKIIGLIITIITGAFLVYAAIDFPAWSDPNSPASTYLSPYFIENSMKDTSVPNYVTSLLADYRGFDTMFETTVIFTAGLVCFILLRISGGKEPETSHYRHVLTGVTVTLKKGHKIPESEDFERIDDLWTPPDLIIKTSCRLMIPFIQLFGLYVIAHGHSSPGGGFQGGVILGASIILLAISHDLRTALEKMREKVVAILCPIGVSIYAGTGTLCLLLGVNFLDYSALASVLHVDPIAARSHGIFMVEIGVGIAVMTTMIWIYNNISSAGKYNQGL
ncbi:MAG: Na(+)/H(+) antiporter subunit B [Proteobacteria bacterium]|nr:Na(+)/H(+) antiporter subunit B [Pseudomonadota bacterium]MBU4298363.1 Na(+)/H(+) antiporter subunit B [Pseudomonadota bacterium]MCG2746918.1 Na(+)/H(+) antiporter subunit B [Desulfobulbaceae bacterium]